MANKYKDLTKEERRVKKTPVHYQILQRPSTVAPPKPKPTNAAEKKCEIDDLYSAYIIPGQQITKSTATTTNPDEHIL